MPVRADLCTAGGILHGGAYMAFADTLGAVGTISTWPGQADDDHRLEHQVHRRRARRHDRDRRVVALHRGRTTMVWQTSIRNADGKLCALVTQTQLVLSNES